MPLANYTELQAAIATFANFTAMGPSIPDFILMAEAQMNRRLRVRAMIIRAEAPITEEFSAVPDDPVLHSFDFLAPISLAIETSESDVEYLTYFAHERLLLNKYRVTLLGRPQFWTIVGDQIRVLPAPDASYTFEITYFAKLPPLALNPTNWLLESHPDAYLYGALLQAGPYLIDDPRLPAWGTMYQTILADIFSSDRVTGGKLRVPTDLQGPPPFNIVTGD